MIRKSGLIIFVVLLAVIFAFVYFLAGSLIRVGMVYGLEKAVGAEVNIEKVSLELAPLGLEIHDLQITDSQKPSHNSLSFSRARADLELWPALLGYYVIDELSIDGLAYGRERKSPGKVFEREKKDGESGEKVDLVKVMKLDIPNADEIMSRAKLHTAEKGDELRKQASEQKRKLAQLEEQLPDKSNIEKIQADIKALSESKIENAADLARKTKELKELQATLKTERDNIRDIQKELRSSRESLKQSVSELREAGKADWQQLQSLANIGDNGLAPISQILLGDIWGERIGQLEGFYLLVKPYIPESEKGGDASEDAEFNLPNRILPLPRQAYPNFWVKTARIQMLLGGGQAKISAKDITAQHDIIDKATLFDLSVKDLPNLKAFTLDGDFKILEKMTTNVRWDLNGYGLSGMSIGKGDSAFSLSKGALGSSGTMKLVDNEITQSAKMVVNNPIFEGGKNQYIQKLTGILNKQTEIPFSVKVSGLISDPKVGVKSNLDSLIGDAILGEAKEKATKLQSQLKARLDKKLEEELGAQSEWLALLDSQEGEAKSLEEKIEKGLDAKLKSFEDKAKDKAKEQLLDSLLKKKDDKKKDEEKKGE